jgi:hypothetical protein
LLTCSIATSNLATHVFAGSHRVTQRPQSTAVIRKTHCDATQKAVHVQCAALHATLYAMGGMQERAVTLVFFFCCEMSPLPSYPESVKFVRDKTRSGLDAREAQALGPLLCDAAPHQLQQTARGPNAGPALSGTGAPEKRGSLRSRPPSRVCPPCGYWPIFVLFRLWVPGPPWPVHCPHTPSHPLVRRHGPVFPRSLQSES